MHDLDRLYDWYDRHQRDLPWRKRRDPYAVWLSEVMLQQTQVPAVIAYFERFMTRFPTVENLATAPLQDVLRAWEGLGYYARARHLHEAARLILERFAGLFPSRFPEILALPGVGRSTAGAIAAAVSGERHPVVDGNVRRVLLRLADCHDDPRASATQEALFTMATALVSNCPDPDRHHQALMELGALVCLPRAPACDRCPLVQSCTAHERGTVLEIPARRPRQGIPHRRILAAMLVCAHHILLQQRPNNGFLGGLWELPQVTHTRGAVGALRTLLSNQLQTPVRVGPTALVVEQAYSHFRVTITVRHCTILRAVQWPDALACPVEPYGATDRMTGASRWISCDHLVDVPMDRATRRIVQTCTTGLPGTSRRQGPPDTPYQPH